MRKVKIRVHVEMAQHRAGVQHRLGVDDRLRHFALFFS